MKNVNLGAKVSHLKYGIGVVKKQWGSWFTCRTCLDECSPPSCKPCKNCGAPGSQIKALKKTDPVRWMCYECYNISLDNPMHVFCPNCQIEQPVLSMGGKEIFDVQFAKELRSIHECWLKVIK